LESFFGVHPGPLQIEARLSEQLRHQRQIGRAGVQHLAIETQIPKPAVAGFCEAQRSDRLKIGMISTIGDDFWADFPTIFLYFFHTIGMNLIIGMIFFPPFFGLKPTGLENPSTLENQMGMETEARGSPAAVSSCEEGSAAGSTNGVASIGLLQTQSLQISWQWKILV